MSSIVTAIRRQLLPTTLRTARRSLSSSSKTSNTDSSSRTFLGVAGGATVCAVTGSLVLWPVADLVFAPMLIAEGMASGKPTTPAASSGEQKDVMELRGLLTKGTARLCVLAGGTQEERSALAREASQGRPTINLSLRQATSPHTMQLALVEALYKPLGVAPLMACLCVWWLSLFDMLIADHAHTRQRDFSVILAQTRRAMQRHAPHAPSDPRPLLVLEHLYVPTGASTEPGGEGLTPMLRSMRQFLCAVSIDDNEADVLVLAPKGSEAGRSAAAAWRGQARQTCAERSVLSGGAIAIALTQSEALESWLSGMRLG